jgi:hypothetical protein
MPAPAPIPLTPKQAAARLFLSNLSPPKHDDWLVTVWFRNHAGRDEKRTLRVGMMQGVKHAITEARAVELALESLKKSLIANKRGLWLAVPKAYDIKAVPRHKAAGQPHHTRYSELLERFQKA